MRIAFSGSHRVGKSTLMERVAEALPGYECLDEPYYLLEEDGYESADPPSTEDFEALLARAIVELGRSGPNVLFDRCPADLVAYLLVGGDAAEGSVERARDAMKVLDLVVFVPIEEPDRIAIGPAEDNEQRHAVDTQLQELLLDDALADDVLIVRGDVAARVAQVLARAPGGGS